MKQLVVVLFISILSAACSSTAKQYSQTNTPSQADAIKVNHNPAMAAVGSATPVMTIKQRLRADPGWNLVANEIVNCVQSLAASVIDLNKSSIYVANLEKVNEQGQAFRSMVMTKLVQNRFNVTFQPENAFHLKYDVVAAEEGVTVDGKLDVIVRVALIKGEQVITSQSEYRTARDENSDHIVQFARNL